MSELVYQDDYWIVLTMGPRYFTATATDKNRYHSGERRIYYSRDAVERDFGPLIQTEER